MFLLVYKLFNKAISTAKFESTGNSRDIQFARLCICNELEDKFCVEKIISYPKLEQKNCVRKYVDSVNVNKNDM